MTTKIIKATIIDQNVIESEKLEDDVEVQEAIMKITFSSRSNYCIVLLE